MTDDKKKHQHPDPEQNNDLEQNPFELPEEQVEERKKKADHPERGDAQHSSDDPGRDYGGPEVRRGAGGPGEHERFSSGPHSPSKPRRAGTGGRGAPRKEAPDLSAPGEVNLSDQPLIPGEVWYAEEDVEINPGSPVTTIKVENPSDRPIQVGSHFHFYEVNPALAFDRNAAWGQRLNVMSGGAYRFEPGAVEEVELIPFKGKRYARGFRDLCGGSLDD